MTEIGSSSKLAEVTGAVEPGLALHAAGATPSLGPLAGLEVLRGGYALVYRALASSLCVRTRQLRLLSKAALLRAILEPRQS